MSLQILRDEKHISKCKKTNNGTLNMIHIKNNLSYD